MLIFQGVSFLSYSVLSLSFMTCLFLFPFVCPAVCHLSIVCLPMVYLSFQWFILPRLIFSLLIWLYFVIALSYTSYTVLRVSFLKASLDGLKSPVFFPPSQSLTCKTPEHGHLKHALEENSEFRDLKPPSDGGSGEFLAVRFPLRSWLFWALQFLVLMLWLFPGSVDGIQNFLAKM